MTKNRLMSTIDTKHDFDSDWDYDYMGYVAMLQHTYVIYNNCTRECGLYTIQVGNKCVAYLCGSSVKFSCTA